MVNITKKITFEINEKGCHIVTSHKQKTGYVMIGRKGFYGLLHRLVYEQKYGLIPISKTAKERFIVCHKCDEPSCINIDHLFLGKDRDNSHDRAIKNRSYAVKLTPEKVKEIKWLLAYDDFVQKQEIARMFNVVDSMISLIIKGRCWKHIEVPPL